MAVLCEAEVSKDGYIVPHCIYMRMIYYCIRSIALYAPGLQLAGVRGGAMPAVTSPLADRE